MAFKVGALMLLVGGVVLYFFINVGKDAVVESWICVEIDRETNPAELKEITNRVLQVLEDVRIAVADWSAMRQAAQVVISAIEVSPFYSAEDKKIAADFGL